MNHMFNNLERIRDIVRQVERMSDPLRILRHSQRNLIDQEVRLREQQEGINELFASIDTRYLEAIEAFRPTLHQLESIRIESPVLADIERVNLVIAAILEQQRDVNAIVAQAQEVGVAWQPQIDKFMQIADSTRATHLALESHFNWIAETTIATHALLAEVQWPEVGAAIEGPISLANQIKLPYLELTNSYSVLVDSFQLPGRSVASFPPIVSGSPPVEVFTASELLIELSQPELDRSLYCFQLHQEIAEETEESLEELLANIDPEFVTMWRGAKAALSSDNPDRRRHVVVSLRELLNHVLHTIAPDERVKEWTSDPNHFSNGRPTRRARLLYVCRTIDHGPFSVFVEKDVAATVAFIGLFHRVHELKIHFSHEQLQALVIQTESTLGFLLSIDQINHEP